MDMDWKELKGRIKDATMVTLWRCEGCCRLTMIDSAVVGGDVWHHDNCPAKVKGAHWPDTPAYLPETYLKAANIEQTFNHLFDLLDDWGRGLKDWNEVEEGITDVKRRLELDQAVS